MNGLSFRLRYPDGRTETLLVDSDRVLVGSGAHCEIRLPPEHAANEHVLITSSGGSVYAQARTMTPPATLNGSPFSQANVLPESVIGVGGIVFAVSISTIDGSVKIVRRKEEKTSPMTYVLAAAMIPLAAYVFFGGNEDEVPPPPKAGQLVLFEKTSAACPQSAKEAALAVATERRLVAEAKRERSPFQVRDGVQAAPLFDVAAACYRTAGDTAAATDLEKAATDLRTSLSQDYKAHQMRLEHSISVSDYRTAQREAKVLLSMLEGRSGAYIDWLSKIDRQIAVKLATEKGSR